MKVFRSLLVVLAMCAVTLPAVQARDSVNFSVNLGVPYYGQPTTVRYGAPPIVYYPAPAYQTYYPAPYAYPSYPTIVYRGNYYGGGHQYRGYSHHGGRHGWR